MPNQAKRNWVFLGVEEPVVGSLLYCGVGILFFAFSIFCVMSFGDCTCFQHQETTAKFSSNITSFITVGAKRKAKVITIMFVNCQGKRIKSKLSPPLYSLPCSKWETFSIPHPSLNALWADCSAPSIQPFIG